MTDRIDLSAGGRLEVHPFVTEAKVREMSSLIDVANSASMDAPYARVRLAQSLSTSDAVFSLAQLINLKNLPDYDVADENNNWRKIASVETVDNFKPQTFYTLRANFSNLQYGKDNADNAYVSPKVAEGDTYQYAYGYTEESIQASIHKRGFKFGVTLEDIINDPTQRIRRIPADMLQIALDTDDFLVFRALQDGAAAAPARQQQAGNAIVGGGAIPKNSPFTAEAARLALQQVSVRTVTVNNEVRRVGLAAQYYIVTALGNGDAIQAELDRANSIIQVVNGQVTYGPPTTGLLGRIAGVIESEWITSTTAWYLVPAAGTTRRPSLVKLQLTGRTAPEVLVNNFTGTPISGISGSAFELCHFDNDTVDLKLRQFTNSAMITNDQLVWSSGLGS